MQLDREELNVVVNALRVAAEVYIDDAEAANRKALPGNGHERVARQFEQQAKEAMALADRIEMNMP